MQTRPLWATPPRRARLAELFAQKLPEITVQFYQNLDRVIFGDLSMSEYINLLTRDVGHSLIENWKEDDREERSYLWRLEKRRLHAMPKIKRRGQFDSIRREQFLADRPMFEVMGIGVAAFTQHMVAKVRIPELDRVIWVDLSGVHVGKNKLRKMARRGGKVPPEIYEIITREVRRKM